MLAVFVALTLGAAILALVGMAAPRRFEPIFFGPATALALGAVAFFVLICLA